MKLTGEQLAKLTKCETAKEVVAAAKDEGVEITLTQAESLIAFDSDKVDREDLKMVSGGCSDSSAGTCPNCGSTNTYATNDYYFATGCQVLRCSACGADFPGEEYHRS